MHFNSKILGGAVALALGTVATGPAQAHPSFINGGSVNTKCGLETMFIDGTGTTTTSGQRTNLVNQDSTAPGTATSSNSKAVDPTSSSYNGSLTAEVGAVNPAIAKNGGSCGPGTGGIMDGIKIGHGTFQTAPEKYNWSTGTGRAFNPTQVDPSTQLANVQYFYSNPIASDVMFPTGEDADSSGNPDCAPASVSSNGTGENYVNLKKWPGNNQTPSTWFNPNALWGANGGQILCRPAVARVLSYTHDGIDIAPNVPTGASGVTSTTAAINVNDGYSPTSNYTKGKYQFTKGNFGIATSLSNEVVYSTFGTFTPSGSSTAEGSYNQAEESRETILNGLSGSGASYVAGAPVKTLVGTFQFMGNPYYTVFTLMKGRDGFHGSKPAVNKKPTDYPINPYLSGGLAGFDPKTGELNGNPAYEITPFTDYSSGSQASTTFHAFNVVKPGRFAFAPGSCARNIVVRPAVSDRAAVANTQWTIPSVPTEEKINTFFGGRTQKYQVGDAGKQNWWMNYVLLHRDDNDPSWNTSTCPISARYDVVVMPTVNDLDTYLPGPGLKRTAPCSTDYYCGTPVNQLNNTFPAIN